MKPLSIVLAFAALLAPDRLRSAQTSDGDEQAVRKVMSDFVDDVNRHDSAAFGRLLADDAEFVVITGQYLKGRKEIEKYHAEIWASEANFKNSKLNWSTLNVRFLRPDVAVAHVSAERVYNSKGDKRTMVVTLVFIKLVDQ